jgi:dipeptidyl-peptidase-4
MTHTDRLKAGIAVAPGSTDLKNYDSVYAERYMGLPAEEWRGYGLSNVNNVAGHLHGRVLIAQGTGDDNVHMENAMQFIQGLITAGIPYDLQIFPRLTHSLATQKARNELLNRILFQFETYLVPIAGSQH